MLRDLVDDHYCRFAAERLLDRRGARRGPLRVIGGDHRLCLRANLRRHLTPQRERPDAVGDDSGDWVLSVTDERSDLDGTVWEQGRVHELGEVGGPGTLGNM